MLQKTFTPCSWSQEGCPKELPTAQVPEETVSEAAPVAPDLPLLPRESQQIAEVVCAPAGPLVPQQAEIFTGEAGQKSPNPQKGLVGLVVCENCENLLLLFRSTKDIQHIPIP